MRESHDLDNALSVASTTQPGKHGANSADERAYWHPHHRWLGL